jgi:hypothetical protein
MNTSNKKEIEAIARRVEARINGVTARETYIIREAIARTLIESRADSTLRAKDYPQGVAHNAHIDTMSKPSKEEIALGAAIRVITWLKDDRGVPRVVIDALYGPLLFQFQAAIEKAIEQHDKRTVARIEALAFK